MLWLLVLTVRLLWLILLLVLLVLLCLIPLAALLLWLCDKRGGFECLVSLIRWVSLA